MTSRTDNTRPDQDQKVWYDLPAGFVEEFLRAIQEFNPVIADELIETGESYNKASIFYKALIADMSQSERDDFTARAFSNLVALGMVISEIDQASIDMSEFATSRDYQRALIVARSEALVQLDDELVEQLDRIAEAHGTNRSELLRRRARSMIEAEDIVAADRQLVEAYRRQPPDHALVESAARLAALTAPEW